MAASAVNGMSSGRSIPDALSVERIYQKKSQLEHILLRPDTYIGSVEPVTELMWVYDSDQEMMVQKTITYVPGLYKIFDEILVNAADNKQRDSKMDCIKIDINQESNTISIWNNGQGIPVVEHKDEKMFVPTMIFGHLLTSSNYNDEEEKVTGGRNGYGAKLCNIFSTKFTVETSSKEYKRAFKQTWSDNMGKASDVKLKDSSSDDYTKITFSPDLSKFKMERLDEDIISLLTRRAYDVAASTRGVKVILNGKRLPVKTFKDYIDLYIKNKEDDVGNPLKVIYESVNPRWEVAITTSDKGFQQVSFVNSIATTKGGRHIDYVADALTKSLMEILKKKNKGGMAIKPFQIKNHMWIFVNCLIVNPTFDSQTKENMTLQAKSFGSKCQLSEKFLTSVSKSGLIEQVLTWAKFKQQTQLEKASAGKKKSKLKGIPKLEDANDAGTKNSLSCTLILTEGDSAKTLAVSGLAVVGRDKYGVFPLRGKLLNVREATHKQILENAEIGNIIKIMGLQYKKKYETVEDLQTLRYGKLMIMTDQDQDGSHIKGLIVNFIHHNWPSLIQRSFLEVFITPIIKATKGGEELCFYSIPEFDEWKNTNQNWKTFRVKYYKGLGTSTSKEAREYFNNMDRHKIRFKYSGPECDQHIIMAFSKKCVEQRKEWLTNWMTERKRRKELGLPEEYLYTKDTKSITYKDFINKELVLFSNMDIERSIPSLVDGLKPGSRKVLYTCFKRNDKKEIKVAQLAGSVAEHSAYHHGEQSLMSTIIHLAHNFVGSNNINLLQPIGQFGTRLHGGKDAASPRYIFTMLSPLARMIFHPHDDPLLKFLTDDNQKIEPVWYCPIIPMVLVNGAEGIGTGWMTKIPNFNPRDIAENLRRLINNQTDLLNLKPWYKNFKGDIDPLIDGKYVISGEVSVINEERIEITELPVGVWTQNYKENVLEPMLNGTDKVPAAINDFKEYHTDTVVKFVVWMNRDKLYNAEREGLHKFFKLQTTTSLSSMCVFDRHNCLRKYENPYDILKDYYDIRLEYYVKRKDYLVGMLEAEARKLSNQARFIIEKCSNILIVENKKKIKIIEELINKGYDSDPVKAWSNAQKKLDEEDEEEESEESIEASLKANEPDFNYLLGMSMWSLTLEKKEELIKKKNERLSELEALQMKTPGDLWTDDLDILLKKLDELEEEERNNEQVGLVDKGKKGKGQAARTPKKKALILSDVMPSPAGRRVTPVIDDDMKKKAETAIRAKEKKLKGETGKRTKKKKGEEGEEKDEFDLVEEKTAKGLKGEKKPRKKKEPGEKKSPEKSEKKSPEKSKKKKANPWSDESEEEEDDIDSDAGGAPALVREKSRRSAASNIKFNFDSENSEGFGSSDDDKMSKAVTKAINDTLSSDEEEKIRKPVTTPPPIVASSDSELDIKPSKSTTSLDDSDKIFDTLLTGSKSKPESDFVDSNSDDSPVKPKAKPKKPPAEKKPRKPPAEKKPKTTKRKDDSDSDEDMFAPKKTKTTAKKTKKKIADSDSDDMFSKPKKKKKKVSSDDDDDDGDSLPGTPPPPRARSGRAAKPICYGLDDGEDDSDF